MIGVRSNPAPSSARRIARICPSIIAEGATIGYLSQEPELDPKKTVGENVLEGAGEIKAQLEAFASGSRRNDASLQMRNVAREMTPDEIDAAAHYYASLQ